MPVKTKPKTPVIPQTRPMPRVAHEPLVFPPERICPDQSDRF